MKNQSMQEWLQERIETDIFRKVWDDFREKHDALLTEFHSKITEASEKSAKEGIIEIKRILKNAKDEN